MAAVSWIHGVNTVSLSQVVRTPIYLEGGGEKRREKTEPGEKNKGREKKVWKEIKRKIDIKEK